MPLRIWPPHEQGDNVRAVKIIQVRTRRSPIQYDVLAVLAAGVLALQRLNVSLLFSDSLIHCRVDLGRLSKVRQRREDDVFEVAIYPGPPGGQGDVDVRLPNFHKSTNGRI